MNNKKTGNSFENTLCEILSENGFWAHNLVQNASGQPADVIAARKGKAYLIDCKVCSKRGFSMSRMEENQDLSMTLWQSCGNGVGWFAILLPQNCIYMVSHETMKMIKQKTSYLNERLIRELGIQLDEWLSTA